MKSLASVLQIVGLLVIAIAIGLWSVELGGIVLGAETVLVGLALERR